MRIRLLAGLLILAVGARAQTEATPAKPTRPFPDVEHLVIISIDGMRPDRMLYANMPAIRGLLAKGAYSFWARTTAVSITLPSHVSMLTGVRPTKHGIHWNTDELPFSTTVYPSVPTVMEMAHRAGYSTAMAAGKSKFKTLDKPGTIQYSDIALKGGESNHFSVLAAENTILQHKPDLIFIHFPDVDATGHKYGWGSKEQLDAIERTDQDIQRILDALKTAGIAEHTTIIVTADHGGAGKTHGADDPRSRHIPWIIAGPHVKQGDLTQHEDLTINTEDTCATACYLLGLPQMPYFDGKPVLAAFENPPAP
jgi:predicted AlkP superfamily pyrophosphatase or phosphodiesterase